jgi:hypothetical protein
MGLQTLLGMTAFYIVKYILYIAIVVAGIFVGKKWADKNSKKKETQEK